METKAATPHGVEHPQYAPDPADPREAPAGLVATLDGKHGDLSGAAGEEAVLASSPDVLRRSRGGSSLIGLQQWFTPEPAARLIADVVGRAEGVLDPMAGSGALLAPFDERVRYGIEIDRDHVPRHAKKASPAGAPRLDNLEDATPEAGSYYRSINGDAQRVVPMLRAAGLRWPAVVANPPFGLTWRDPRHAKGTVNSTVLAYLWALDLLAPYGQGAIVLGRDRLAREIMGRPEAAGVYAIADVEGPLFDGVALPCSIAFFVRPENRDGGYPVRLSAPRDGLPDLADRIRDARSRASGRVSLYGHERGAAASLPQAFSLVSREAERRAAARKDERASKRGRFDATLKGQRVSVSLSGFAQLALAKEGPKRAIELLDGQNCSYFGQNTRALGQLEDLSARGLLTVDPALVTRARQAAAEGEIAAPFAKLTRMQLLYLIQVAMRDNYGYEFLAPALEEAALMLVDGDEEEQIRAYALFLLSVAYIDAGRGESFDWLLEKFKGHLPLDLSLAVCHEGDALESRNKAIKKLRRKVMTNLKDSQKVRAQADKMYDRPIAMLGRSVEKA